MFAAWLAGASDSDNTVSTAVAAATAMVRLVLIPDLPPSEGSTARTGSGTHRNAAR
ncbi:hypothetical protein Pen02_43360 [Plantactinospora endophytica]|uniref:Uncharacterized protein n=1 Tax=Plantactinospora endophytica TaxID=673535 RepID=A0ABQ4E3Z0_9ACTN|nr:hypothetical protein Pen02_43360 [Plantactinospora endophytica]